MRIRGAAEGRRKELELPADAHKIGREGLYLIYIREAFSASELQTHCDYFLKMYGRLALEAEAADLQAWRVKPKFHMLYELSFHLAPLLGSPYRCKVAITTFRYKQ